MTWHPRFRRVLFDEFFWVSIFITQSDLDLRSSQLSSDLTSQISSNLLSEIISRISRSLISNAAAVPMPKSHSAILARNSIAICVPNGSSHPHRHYCHFGFKSRCLDHRIAPRTFWFQRSVVFCFQIPEKPLPPPEEGCFPEEPLPEERFQLPEEPLPLPVQPVENLPPPVQPVENLPLRRLRV